ncbi:hypothetical protein BOX15_Mlig033887g1 [Macrostomum lignano]|uniref:Uncharacterized protein n=1 Tax=Macrostomum lignano TaxID=282301 RepID=A0A267DGZ1_9PLAT|nr:hypothetical protein BOX15_Mlig002794g1 [Macrostomum lignano]PAA57242.1 hypothetical protein BOX15_Mlig033887g1 [Macrostomum lignano]
MFSEMELDYSWASSIDSQFNAAPLPRLEMMLASPASKGSSTRGGHRGGRGSKTSTVTPRSLNYSAALSTPSPSPVVYSALTSRLEFESPEQSANSGVNGSYWFTKSSGRGRGRRLHFVNYSSGTWRSELGGNIAFNSAEGEAEHVDEDCANIDLNQSVIDLTDSADQELCSAAISPDCQLVKETAAESSCAPLQQQEYYIIGQFPVLLVSCEQAGFLTTNEQSSSCSMLNLQSVTYQQPSYNSGAASQPGRHHPHQQSNFVCTDDWKPDFNTNANRSSEILLVKPSPQPSQQQQEEQAQQYLKQCQIDARLDSGYGTSQSSSLVAGYYGSEQLSQQQVFFNEQSMFLTGEQQADRRQVWLPNQQLTNAETIIQPSAEIEPQYPTCQQGEAADFSLVELSVCQPSSEYDNLNSSAGASSLGSVPAILGDSFFDNNNNIGGDKSQFFGLSAGASFELADL